MNGSEQQYLDVVSAPQEPVNKCKHIFQTGFEDNAEIRTCENKLS